MSAATVSVAAPSAAVSAPSVTRETLVNVQAAQGESRERFPAAELSVALGYVVPAIDANAFRRYSANVVRITLGPDGAELLTAAGARIHRVWVAKWRTTTPRVCWLPATLAAKIAQHSNPPGEYVLNYSGSRVVLTGGRMRRPAEATIEEGRFPDCTSLVDRLADAPTNRSIVARISGTPNAMAELWRPTKGVNIAIDGKLGRCECLRRFPSSIECGGEIATTFNPDLVADTMFGMSHPSMAFTDQDGPAFIWDAVDSELQRSAVLMPLARDHS